MKVMAIMKIATTASVYQGTNQKFEFQALICLFTPTPIVAVITCLNFAVTKFNSSFFLVLVKNFASAWTFGRKRYQRS